MKRIPSFVLGIKVGTAVCWGVVLASCSAGRSEQPRQVCFSFVRTDLAQLDARINAEIARGYRVVAMTHGNYEGYKDAFTVLMCEK